MQYKCMYIVELMIRYNPETNQNTVSFVHPILGDYVTLKSSFLLWQENLMDWTWITAGD